MPASLPALALNTTCAFSTGREFCPHLVRVAVPTPVMSPASVSGAGGSRSLSPPLLQSMHMSAWRTTRLKPSVPCRSSRLSERRPWLHVGLKCFCFSGVPAARHVAGFSEPMVIIGYILTGALCLHLGLQLERELHTPLLKALRPPPAGCPPRLLWRNE